MSSSSAAAEDYAALMRDDISISDVTSDEGSAEILRDLKDNNPNLYEIYLTGGNVEARSGLPAFDVYDTRGLGVLGFLLGRSANVTTLHIQLPGDIAISAIEPFLLELRNNRSIETLELLRSYVPCEFSNMLTPFIASNPNLTDFDVRECSMEADEYRALSAALSEGNSLKNLCLVDGGGHYGDVQAIIDNIEALKMHPQLERFRLAGFYLERRACAAFSDLLSLKSLILDNSQIDDTGVEALAGGLAHCRSLRELSFSGISSITIRGWRALSSLLENENSTLWKLALHRNDINDEIAILLANALERNSALETLYLSDGSEVTGEGWAAFSRILCDTTSVNSTFLSNHTLNFIDGLAPQYDVPDDVRLLLTLNQERDKKALSIRKILRYHDNFDMQPLFEWDLKVLPLVVGLFERAAACEMDSHIPYCSLVPTFEFKTMMRKLAALYQFMRGMPELAIECITGTNTKSGKVGGEKRPHSTAFEEE